MLAASVSIEDFSHIPNEIEKPEAEKYDEDTHPERNEIVPVVDEDHAGVIQQAHDGTSKGSEEQNDRLAHKMFPTRNSVGN